MSSDTTFVRLPQSLALSNLSHPAVRLWAVLKAYEWSGKLPQIENLCAHMDATERSVLRWVRELELAGWLEWNRKSDLSRRYRTISNAAPSPEQYTLARLRSLIDSGAGLDEVKAILGSGPGNVTPESDHVTPESDHVTPGSDTRIRSYDQIVVSPDLTPRSDSVTPESDDLTPESDQPSAQGSAKPKNAGPRILDQERSESTTTGGGGGNDHPLLGFLVDRGMNPSKAREILARWPDLDYAAAVADYERRAANKAGPGAIAESWLISPPRPQADEVGKPRKRVSDRPILESTILTGSLKMQLLAKFRRCETDDERRKVLDQAAQEERRLQGGGDE